MEMKKKLVALSAAAMLIFSSCSLKDTDSADNSTTSIAPDSNVSVVTPTSTSLPAKPFTTTTTGAAHVTISGNDFTVGGKTLWLNGVNAPWIAWNDFGGDFDLMSWNNHFQSLHNSGVNAARVWISCNGDVGMEISADGTFTGATTAHWEDLDSLVMLAEKYHIYLMATVMSFDHFKNTNQNYMSWRAMVQDDAKIDTYVNNYIIPLVKRYDSSDYFWSIDLCNEPDWVIENDECGKLSWDAMTHYFAKAAAAIHANSDVLVTVGMGMPKYNSDDYSGNVIADDKLKAIFGDDNAYMDFYSTHWYAWEYTSFTMPFLISPSIYKLDDTKPNVLGEFSATDNSYMLDGLTSKYKGLYENGWDGGFAWKSSGTNDGNGLIYDIVPATQAMVEIAKDKIFPLGDDQKL
ncbi:MAG: cellulase family glycosylhydrolase [Oscillospiraceae bacterium]